MHVPSSKGSPPFEASSTRQCHPAFENIVLPFSEDRPTKATSALHCSLWDQDSTGTSRRATERICTALLLRFEPGPDPGLSTRIRARTESATWALLKVAQPPRETPQREQGKGSRRRCVSATTSRLNRTMGWREVGLISIRRWAQFFEDGFRSSKMGSDLRSKVGSDLRTWAQIFEDGLRSS